MSVPARRPHDLVIFGATGFTGAFVALELARLLTSQSPLFPTGLRVGLGARSSSRLAALLDRLASEVPGFDRGHFTPILADVGDEASLVAMCEGTRLLLNCVGPYRLWGEPVVKACLEGGCHYLDITGEPEFMERAELKFHEEARSKGLFIVPCSAFDSIPADLGVAFAVEALAQHCSGASAASVASYLTLHTGPSGFGGHYATFQSAVLGFGSVAALKRTRREFEARYPHLARIPLPGPAPPRRGAYFWSGTHWCLPFIGSDASVVRRSQRALHGERLLAAAAAGEGAGGAALPLAGLPLPVHYEAFFTVASTWNLFLTVLFGGALSLLAPFEWGRRLLLGAPGLFSGGIFSHEGPSQQQLQETSFSMTFVVRGFSGGQGAAGSGGAPDVEAKCCVRGPEPGYVATPRLLLGAAATLLEERARPAGAAAGGGGGGRPPGAALAGGS